jgi:hypothetical protein
LSDPSINSIVLTLWRFISHVDQSKIEIVNINRINLMLEKVPHWALILFCGATIVLLGWVDYIIVPHTSEDFFYLLPIMAVAWYVGFRPGIGLAVFAALVCFFSISPENKLSTVTFVLIWNSLSIGTIFVIVSSVFLFLMKGFSNWQKWSVWIH